MSDHFCGRPGQDVQGLGGVRDRPVRICNDCVDLCLASMRGEGAPITAPPVAESTRWDAIESALDNAESRSDVENLILEVEDVDGWFRGRPKGIVCSFCDAHQEDVAKIIAGPTAHICDGCIGGAATLFASCSTYAVG